MQMIRTTPLQFFCQCSNTNMNKTPDPIRIAMKRPSDSPIALLSCALEGCKIIHPFQVVTDKK